jgi:hypothetical protein
VLGDASAVKGIIAQEKVVVLLSLAAYSDSDDVSLLVREVTMAGRRPISNRPQVGNCWQPAPQKSYNAPRRSFYAFLACSVPVRRENAS